MIECRTVKPSATVILVFIALAMGGCMESKSQVFAACHQEHVAYFLQPRPQGRPPDEYLIGGLDLCMMSHGFRMASTPSCKSPATVTGACFRPLLPQAWLRSRLDWGKGAFAPPSNGAQPARRSCQ
jgi:hypothetical protein